MTTTPQSRRWGLRAAAVGLVAALGLGYGLPASADQLDDREHQLTTQIDTASASVDESTKRLDDALARLKSSQDELAAVQAALAATQDKVTAATATDARLADQLRSAQAALDAANGAVEASRLVIDGQRAAVGEIARDQVQQQHNLMGLAVLVQQGSTAELQTRIQLSTTMLGSTQAQLDRLHQLQTQLETAQEAQTRATAKVAADRAASVQSLTALTQLRATQADQQRTMAAAVAADQQAEASAKAEVAKNNQAYQDLTAERDKVSADIAARDTAAQPGAGNSPTASPATASSTPTGAVSSAPSAPSSASASPSLAASAAAPAPTGAATPSPSPSATTTTAPSASTALWRPAKGTTWQWQLTGTVDLSVDAAVYDVDGFDVSKDTITKLHQQGRRAICYIDAGSYENWRSDAGTFPSKVLGSAMDGWPGERWLDVRQLDALKPIMEKRFQMCKDKGFDAIEADNVDGYSNKTGFPITSTQQIAYNRMLAALAHQRGLSIGLKNTPDLVGNLVNDFDFAVVEQCYEYGECTAFTPFIRQNKAVLHVEYNVPVTKFCATTKGLGFSSMLKKLDLGAWRQVCP